MLGARQRVTPVSGLVDWAGRDRASKVVAAAATIAHGWNRLDDRELERLSEALEDHSRAYGEWLGSMEGGGVDGPPAVHRDAVREARAILAEIRGANRRMRLTSEPVARRELAASLGRSASDLVDQINAATLVIDLSRD
jgi:hypothetical protein